MAHETVKERLAKRKVRRKAKRAARYPCWACWLELRHDVGPGWRYWARPFRHYWQLARPSIGTASNFKSWGLALGYLPLWILGLNAVVGLVSFAAVTALADLYESAHIPWPQGTAIATLLVTTGALIWEIGRPVWPTLFGVLTLWPTSMARVSTRMRIR